MNKYCIYAFFGYPLPLEERLIMIKNAGFDSVMLWWGNEFEETEGKRTRHPDIARRHGLNVENVHAPYQYADDLWDDGLGGDGFEKIIAESIRDCAECGVKTLVMHLENGLIRSKPSAAGLKRMERLLTAAEREDVTLALENVHDQKYLDWVFSCFHSDHLGFCYDCGHEFATTGKLTLLEKYGSILKALHLHDNNGIKDQHRIPWEGRIDWLRVTSLLSSSGYTGPVSLESMKSWEESADRAAQTCPEHYLAREYEASKRLSRMIHKKEGVPDVKAG